MKSNGNEVVLARKWHEKHTPLGLFKIESWTTRIKQAISLTMNDILLVEANIIANEDVIRQNST